MNGWYAMGSFGNDIQADLCIVGSGIAAMLLAERAMSHGRRVVMLERGTRLTFEERRKQKSHADPLPFNKSSYRSPHEHPGGYSFRPVYNLGGSTNHFYGNMPRIHPAHFKAEPYGGADRTWPISYAELEPYYLQVEDRLRISGNSERTPFPGRFRYPLPPHRLSPSDRASERVFGPEHVTQVPTVRPSRAVDGRPPCCGTNTCGLCPVDSKGTALNLVYPSIRDRIDLRSGVLVTSVHCRNGRVDAVAGQDSTGQPLRVHAREFVIACNGVDTPLLLERSPDVPKHPSLGRYYMDHPAFDVAILDSGLDARPGYGDSAQTGMVTAFFERVADDLPVSLLGEIKSAELSKGHGSSNRDAVVADVLQLAMSEARAGRRPLRDSMGEKWRSVLYLRFLVETQPLRDNTVRISEIEETGQAIPQITLTYPEYMSACIDRVTAYIQRRLPRATVKVLSRSPTVQHWMGATRMSDSPRDGCVDRNLRYHDLENLYVASGSVFPSSSSANPTLTIAALSLRLGDHLKA